MAKKIWEDQDKFIHRDLSWLAFNERVLEEAVDERNPLLERVKFLSIFISNLDEFFMVRVAGMRNLIDSEYTQKDKFGWDPPGLYVSVRETSTALLKKLYEIYEGKINFEFGKNSIFVKKYEELTSEQRKYVQDYFETTLFPIMTPMAVDQGHPFPVLPSKTLAFAINVFRKNSVNLAIIPVPKNVPRLLKLPSGKNEYHFILIDDVIRQNLKSLFRGYRIREATIFRVIRDSELTIEEEFTPNLLKAIEEEVRKRARARVVYLEVEKNTNEEMLESLSIGFNFKKEEILSIGEHIDLTFMSEFVSHIDNPNLFFPEFVRQKTQYDNIFQKITDGDFIIHLPYQSFFPTIDLIQTAAKDENVLAIKMTLYRTNENSSIIQALKEAARRKKQVTVLVEIKARFEEEKNIIWARELEEAGCHVIYGIPGLKIHSKMTLIVRKEDGHIRRYVHLSTGNYNEITSKVYTDIGYFTMNDDFAKDVSDVFNVLTGYSMISPWKRIISSPNDLREYFFSLVDKEIEFHQKSKNGFIRVKMNSLEDTRIIEKLYEASQAGVKIQILVRGICCLVPGIKGLSENIEVHSVVGRFLEHSRIYIFNNHNSPRIFLASADWMERNFDRRIELLFEITKEEIKNDLKNIWEISWKDILKTRVLTSDKKYVRLKASDVKMDSQQSLIERYAS
jgi:polyphosphate kinase